MHPGSVFQNQANSKGGYEGPENARQGFLKERITSQSLPLYRLNSYNSLSRSCELCANAGSFLSPPFAVKRTLMQIYLITSTVSRVGKARSSVSKVVTMWQKRVLGHGADFGLALVRLTIRLCQRINIFSFPEMGVINCHVQVRGNRSQCSNQSR